MHAVESVVDVVFASANGPISRVGMASEVKDAGKRPAELHCVCRSVGQCRFVDRGPSPVPGVVAQQAGSSLSFGLDGGRGVHSVEVSDQLIGQHHPELLRDHVGHFLS